MDEVKVGSLSFSKVKACKERIFSGMLVDHNVTVLKLRQSESLKRVENNFYGIRHQNICSVVHKSVDDDQDVLFAIDNPFFTLADYINLYVKPTGTEDNIVMRNYESLLKIVKQLFDLLEYLHNKDIVCHGLKEDFFFIDKDTLIIQFCPYYQFEMNDDGLQDVDILDLKHNDLMGAAKICYRMLSGEDFKSNLEEICCLEFEDDYADISRTSLIEMLESILCRNEFPTSYKLSFLILWDNRKIMDFIIDVNDLIRSKTVKGKLFVGLKKKMLWTYNLDDNLKAELFYSGSIKCYVRKQQYQGYKLEDFVRFVRDLFTHIKTLKERPKALLINQAKCCRYFCLHYKEQIESMYDQILVSAHKNSFYMKRYFKVKEN